MPAKRPETKEGGREEEEKRLGIATRPFGTGRLRRAKTVSVNVFIDTHLCALREVSLKKFRVGMNFMGRPSGVGVGKRSG
jgi:hypothetical protein